MMESKLVQQPIGWEGQLMKSTPDRNLDENECDAEAAALLLHRPSFLLVHERCPYPD